jgi:cytochrome c biogenesis protein CcmG/thiol:disulfide interchange protein DsbE
METTSLPPDDRPPEARTRRTNRGLLWAAVLAVVVLAVATIVAFSGGSSTPTSDVQRIDPNATLAPEVELTGTDVTGQAIPAVAYKTFDGTTVPLSTGGKPLVLNFWASNCGPCVKEMPDLEQSFQANQGRVGYLGLQVAEAASLGQQMIDRTGATYPVGRDPGGDILQDFGGIALPRTVLVRADGTIAYVHPGPITAAELQQAIDEKLTS